MTGTLCQCGLLKKKGILLPKIFVSIAAYEDPLLARTIKSLLDNADHPENISFGICLQYSEDPELPKLKQDVRLLKFNPETRPGIVKIRYLISQLLQDEDFYLQIDSHYLFEQSWDTKLINHYNILSQKYNTEKVYILPLGPFGDERMSSRWKINEIDDVRIGMLPENSRVPLTDVYTEIPYARVGQCFFPADFIRDVGMDPYTQVGHEIAYFSYRMFMSGYTMIQVNENLMNQEDEEYLAKNWSNNKENRFGSALAKDNPMTEYELTLALIYNDYSKYAIKNAVRTAEDFWIANDEHEKYKEVKEKLDRFIRNEFN